MTMAAEIKNRSGSVCVISLASGIMFVMCPCMASDQCSRQRRVHGSFLVDWRGVRFESAILEHTVCVFLSTF